MSAADFARRIRSRERALGYWSVIDSPVSTEWLAHVGWDYICLDLQHGLIGYDGMLRGLTAIDAAQGPAGLVRVESNDQTYIGKALDAGARGVIVPLIDTAEDAARAVSYVRYPPAGVRSYGPMRSQLRVGPLPAEANDSVVVLAMIETPDGLENVEAICAVPGLDGVYVGPSDLRIAVGGASPRTAPWTTCSTLLWCECRKLPPRQVSRPASTPPPARSRRSAWRRATPSRPWRRTSPTSRLCPRGT